jgi:phosphonate transport system substrate-binding protein
LKTLSWLLTLLLLVASATQAEPLRLGITSATARGQYVLLEECRMYLQNKLNHPVEFIFRESYLENIDLLKQNKLDFAWISSPAYFENMQQTKLLVTPLYKGLPIDRSYLIVAATDHRTKSLIDLKNKVFAFVDPDSSTGYLEPRYRLKLAKQDPENFFQKTFFTRDDQKIVAAVAIGLADAGSMSGFAWESLALTRPDITNQTRIVAKSAAYGFPPIISRNNLNKKYFTNMQRALVDMSDDTEGKKLLKQLNLDGFTTADKKMYQSDYLLMQRVGDL